VATLRWHANTMSGWIDVDAGIMHRRGTSVAESSKKRTPMPVPRKLLAHARRWKRLTEDGPIEFRGRVVRDVGDGFKMVCGRAGFDDVIPHTLKHTSITWMMRNGVPTWEVAQYAGTSEKTILEVYGHHHPDHMRRAVGSWG
jgi:integrase